MQRFTRWFRLWWWSLLYHCWRGDGVRGSSWRLPAESWSHFICRVRGHPCGVIWFDMSGDEPNMQCKNCGDDLG